VRFCVIYNVLDEDKQAFGPFNDFTVFYLFSFLNYFLHLIFIYNNLKNRDDNDDNDDDVDDGLKEKKSWTFFFLKGTTDSRHIMLFTPVRFSTYIPTVRCAIFSTECTKIKTKNGPKKLEMDCLDF
jgi:hypothetical protein